MNRWEYNCRDNLAQAQIFQHIYPMLDDETRRVYEAEMGLQGACLGVQMRGILIDPAVRQQIISEIRGDQEALERQISGLAGKEVNPRSPDQLMVVFYEDCRLRVQKDRKTGNPTTAEDVLKKIEKGTIAVAGDYPNINKSAFKRKAGEIAGLMLKYRDLEKQVEAAEAKLHFGRMRTTLNVGGTESYRLSSTKDHFGCGINQQNQDKRLRRMYVPDPGFLMGQMDQERAESLTVAYCSGDQRYIDAHLRENTHVYVARILWPNIAWQGDRTDKDRAKRFKPDGSEASNSSGRESMYDVAKSIQHGLNFLMTPNGLAVYAHITQVAARIAFERYFEAFPGIQPWQASIIDAVRETGLVHGPGGYHRVFFGRRWDRHTWKEAISFIPQSVVAWTNHIVFKRLYYELDGPDFQVLGHIHDAVLFQVRQNLWADYASALIEREPYKPRVIELSKVTWSTKGGMMTIPFEIKTGTNWRNIS